MTYWHIQMHPNDKSRKEEKEILAKGFIGLGKWKNNSGQIKQFKTIKKGDVIVVKRGATPLALVEVISEKTKAGAGIVAGNHWIYYRRDIKILDDNVAGKLKFPQPRGTLQKSINKYTQTYKYIDNWYKKVLSADKGDVGFKIREIDIKEYKILHDFKIDFLDKENQPLPIIVIAGKNGTGKTTLLKYIKKLNDGITYQLQGNILKSDTNSLDPKNIIYIDAVADNDSQIEQLILNYIDYFIYDKSESAAVGAENLQNDIDEIFAGFDLNFQFKKIDYKTKKPLFENYNNIRDDVEFNIQALSTGEKTLLSKVLYLYLQEPKNKVILIDEPETSLHPSWQNKTLKFYENFAKINNNQIIIATHSPHIIGSAKNEYIRVLNIVDDKIETIDDLKACGRDINSILFDIMGEVSYRPKVFVNTIDKLHIAIDDKNFKEAKKILDKLKINYGEDDAVITEARMLIDMFEPNEK